MINDYSFYWFDYETFGTHPAWDRPCQFAGIRTDMNLEQIGEPLKIYCQQSMDYLPHPMACQVTGLSPQQVNERGISENLFIRNILAELGKPGTCSVGYNSIRFDDEFTRFTAFRNFHDPYEHEYKDQNSRWDLLDVVRLTRALRPEGINWPENQDGTPSNKLEHLRAANSIDHGDAHDALSDVRATIGLARLIRQKQPRLFKHAFENRSKHAVNSKLFTGANEPLTCLQISSMIPSLRANLAVILPLTPLKKNPNSVIVLDLHTDPRPLLTMDATEIANLVFGKDPHGNQPPLSRQCNDGKSETSYRPGLRTVQINKCPVIVAVNALLDEDAARLDIDKEEIREHERIARENLLTPERLAIIEQAMSREWPMEEMDAEGALYSGGFISTDDKQRARTLRASVPPDIFSIAKSFEDKRLRELAARYAARNFPDFLSSDQRINWQEHCRDRLSNEAAPWLSAKKFDIQMSKMNWTEENRWLAQELEAYARAVKQHAGLFADS